VCGWHAGSGGPPDTAPLALPTTTPGRLLTDVPTSRDHQSGKRTDLAESWSLATTVYGKPDYAQLFTWTGPEGYPITCTITVDGHVTARLTTHGPWGKIFCQG
jgi:hypothetical protein